MVSLNNNNWKYLSFVLMGIIAIPVVTAISAPQAFAAAANSVEAMVTDIKNKVNDATFGLQSIKTAVDTKSSQISVDSLQTTANGIKTKTDNLPPDPASNSHIDSALSSLATGTAIGTLQTTADAIKAKTDNLPNDLNAQLQVIKCNSPLRENVDLSNCNLINLNAPGADFHYDNLSGANLFGGDLHDASFIFANLSGANLAQGDRHHAVFDGANMSGANLSGGDFHDAFLENVNLSGANLSGTNFQGADLTGINTTGCTGTPTGTPSKGTLPTC